MIIWTIHPIADSDQGGSTMYALLPSDGTTGLLVGERCGVQAVADALARFLATGEHGSEIPDVHEQLGTPWLTVREASEDWHIPRATITLALRQDKIHHAEKYGNRWRFPQRAFLAWLAKR